MQSRYGFVAAILLASAGGCVLTDSTAPAGPEAAGPVTVEYGRPNRFVDGTGWVLGIPSKLALWDRRADNHQVSPRTVRGVVEYLEHERLSGVLVRVNQYDPLGEWKRLATNRRIGLGWRMTTGAFETAKYGLLPGRLFGEDWYNPFTNTVHVYSDIPSLAIARAAYAKDVHSRTYPGTYASVQMLPIVGMWHETIATKDALEYIRSHGTPAEREEAYRILYPSYGGTWGAGVASFLPFGAVYARVAGAAVGHLANSVRKSGDG